MAASSLVLIFPSNCSLPRRSLKKRLSWKPAELAGVGHKLSETAWKMKMDRWSSWGGASIRSVMRRDGAHVPRWRPWVLFRAFHQSVLQQSPSPQSESSRSSVLSHSHTHTHAYIHAHSSDEGKQLTETTPTHLFRLKLKSCFRFSRFSSFFCC